MEAKERLIVALDVNSLEEADRLVQELAPHVGMFKVGLELMTAVGSPRIVNFLRDQGVQVFFDGKFKDIPTTMARAARAAAQLGVYAFNVHASAGIDAMLDVSAVKGGSKAWAVTVLTSKDTADCETDYGATTPAKVLQWARHAKLGGMDGIICSPQELPFLSRRRELAGMDFVTPGVRPEWAPLNDQKRPSTPYEAVRAGATHLVVGRPITNPPGDLTCVQAAKMILREIEEALAA